MVLPSFSINEFTKPGKFEPFDTSHRDDGVSLFGGRLYEAVLSSITTKKKHFTSNNVPIAAVNQKRNVFLPIDGGVVCRSLYGARVVSNRGDEL